MLSPCYSWARMSSTGGRLLENLSNPQPSIALPMGGPQPFSESGIGGDRVARGQRKATAGRLSE